MKELVLFYSYSGNTKNIASKYAAENNCDICEVINEKKHNKFYSYVIGCFKAMKGGVFKIQPLMINQTPVNFEDYDTVNIFAPIWAGHPAPSMNSALNLIPKNKKTKLFMVSASGESSKDVISKRVESLGLEILNYEDIKS